MHRKILITEIHLETAIAEQNLLGVTAGTIEKNCHCVVANALADEFGQPVIAMGYNSAELQNGTFILWNEYQHGLPTEIKHLIRNFDNGKYESARQWVPMELEVEYETRNSNN